MGQLYAIEQEIGRYLADQEEAEIAAEAVEARATEYRADDAKLREAESWVAGSFESEHYTDVTLALHALHHKGATQDVLANLFALAKVEAAAVDAQLAELAERDLRDEAEQRACDAAEAAAERRVAA